MSIISVISPEESMDKSGLTYSDYIKILKDELVLAMGCTEPIAIAYVAAKAREILGVRPEKMDISLSGNIIKNVKSAVVPNTDGLRGIETSAAAGVIFGKTEKKLEVLSEASQKDKTELRDYLNDCQFSVSLLHSTHALDIQIKAFAGEENVSVRVSEYHANIVKIEKNGMLIYDAECEPDNTHDYIKSIKERLTVEGIYEFAENVHIQDIRDLLQRQVDCNTRIAAEGLKNPYGAQIGRTLLDVYGTSNVARRASAKAAAGSDARMNGCELPVVINSGSGNQGITVSVPVAEYADELNVSKEKLYRALVISNLVAVHLKTGIGVLSAYCGAVSAGAACGAGIAYLHGGDLRIMNHTIVNALAITSGIICDGAKASCAAKISSAVDAGILGYQMIAKGCQFRGEDGILKKGVEETIHNIYRLGSEGMQETDEVIMDMMTSQKYVTATI